MPLEDSLLAVRLRDMLWAEELKNVVAACRELGLNRTRFCRWRRQLEPYRRDGLHPRPQQARPGALPHASRARLVVVHALAGPGWGGRATAWPCSSTPAPGSAGC